MKRERSDRASSPVLALHCDMLKPAQLNRHTHNKTKKVVTVLAISDLGQAPERPGEEVQGREGMTYSQPFSTNKGLGLL